MIKNRKLHRVWLLIVVFMLFFSSTACMSSETTSDNNKIALPNLEQYKNPILKQEPNPSTTEQGTMGPFWKVSNNGNVVYLLGSIHVATEDFYPLHGKIESAFAESDYLAVEADILNIDLFEIQREIDKRAKYTDRTKLQDHLPPFLYARVKKAFKDYGLNLDLFNSYKPWYISMLLDNLKTMEIGLQAELGIDYHFLKKASGYIEIIELEGMEFQLDLFDSYSEELQVELLKAGLIDNDQYKEEIERMVELWKAGDAEGIIEAMGEPEEDNELMREYNEGLLDNRNVGMADKIEGFLKGNDKKKYFVIVGAAHYGGKMGVIKLLEDKGFTVDKQEP